MTIEEYLDEFESKVKEFDRIIVSSKLDKEIDFNLTRGYLKGRIIFVDGTELEFMEQLPVNLTKYRFHYMDSANQLILRWDSAPHFRQINTFPFHLHKPGGVEAHPSITLVEVLNLIKDLIDV